ncbi:HdeD family acid-resistance protein [Vibrio sp. SCSIO 43137]|uniref:HdeD family acid-resistance protein n=1 Tax=Vibrio sp. SCSIO 43137 TaxID=3021011 RepID=UPI0023072842|nr:DUF308 domain-containing protein [Vibrio sp. SCSIO 43137]WCE28907.1 DUF308 domain-containing protein [Vibrio sp. SCSIO 43137]
MKSWKTGALAGVLSISGGVTALINPVATSITLEQIMGWTFIVSGLFSFIGYLAGKNSSDNWSAALALFSIGLGALLVSFPLESVLSLSVFIVMLLVGTGVSQLTMAFSRRGTPAFYYLFVSSLISLVFAFMVLSDFPAGAEGLIGVIFSVELITNGIALLTYSITHRKATTIHIQNI